MLGLLLADPSHPDYVPNVFRFKKHDEVKSKMQLQRYESAKKRATYEKPAQATNPQPLLAMVEQ